MPDSLLQRDIERELLPMAEGLGLTVAAWSPLAGGVLSGKFTCPQGSEPGTRIDPASITTPQRAVAQAVQSAADDLGATPSQVAIAWTRARSPVVHPIIGARRLVQLQDNLGAAHLDLPAEVVARLDAAAGIDLGFPATFIQDNTPWVFARPLSRRAADGYSVIQVVSTLTPLSAWKCSRNGDAGSDRMMKQPISSMVAVSAAPRTGQASTWPGCGGTTCPMTSSWPISSPMVSACPR